MVRIPNAGENVEELDHLSIGSANVKWYNHSGNNLSISLKKKKQNFFVYIYTTEERHSWAFSHRNENLCPHAHTKWYLHIHLHFITNSPKLETTPMFYHG